MARKLKAVITALTIAAAAAASAGAASAQAHGPGWRGPAHRFGYGPYRFHGYRGPYWGGYYGPGPWFGFAPPPYPYVYGPYGPPAIYYGPPPPPPVYYPPPPPPPPRERPAPPAPPPVERPAPPPERFEVYFPFDRSEITPEAAAVIRSAAAYDARNHGGHIVVVGHTDTSGSEGYNQPLSERRARAVRAALAADGVDVSAVEMDWKGKHDLEVPTGDQVKEPRNRRVTILIEPGR